MQEGFFLEKIRRQPTDTRSHAYYRDVITDYYHRVSHHEVGLSTNGTKQALLHHTSTSRGGRVGGCRYRRVRCVGARTAAASRQLEQLEIHDADVDDDVSHDTGIPPPPHSCRATTR